MQKITWMYVNGKGRGVFATAHIHRGELVERSPVDALSLADAETDALRHIHFAYGPDDNGSALGFGYLGLYNHSANPNITLDRHSSENEIEVYALREIKDGEELTYDYGVPLWFEPI